MTKIKEIKHIAFNDKAAVKKEIDNFIKKYAYVDVEHALEISPNGNMYILTGTKNNVNSEIIGKDALKHSIGIHNHPVPKSKIMGDSFSKQDLLFAVEYKTGKQYLVSGKRRDAFIYTGNLSETELYEAYEKAKFNARNNAWENAIEIEYLQADTMRELMKIIEGFEFYENF